MLFTGRKTGLNKKGWDCKDDLKLKYYDERKVKISLLLLHYNILMICHRKKQVYSFREL